MIDYKKKYLKYKKKYLETKKQSKKKHNKKKQSKKKTKKGGSNGIPGVLDKEKCRKGACIGAATGAALGAVTGTPVPLTAPIGAAVGYVAAGHDYFQGEGEGDSTETATRSVPEPEKVWSRSTSRKTPHGALTYRGHNRGYEYRELTPRQDRFREDWLHNDPDRHTFDKWKGEFEADKRNTEVSEVFPPPYFSSRPIIKKTQGGGGRPLQ